MLKVTVQPSHQLFVRYHHLSFADFLVLVAISDNKIRIQRFMLPICATTAAAAADAWPKPCIAEDHQPN